MQREVIPVTGHADVTYIDPHPRRLVPLLLTRGVGSQAQDATVPDKAARTSPSSVSSSWSISPSTRSMPRRHMPRRSPKRRRRSPSSRSEDIDRFGYRTLADILRGVRGFYVTNDRNYSYLGVRGFSRPGDYNARVLLLVDGHRLNDNVFGSALIGTEFPLDIDLIERVEIIRGPSSSLYGTSAFFAVINVITKSGDGVRGSMSPACSAPSRPAAAASASASRSPTARRSCCRRPPTQSTVSAAVLPEFDTPETNYGVARRRRRRQLHTLLRQVSRSAASPCRRCTDHATRSSRPRRSAPSSTTRGRGRSRHSSSWTLQYERALGSAWHAGARVYYDRYAYDGTYVFRAAEEADAPSRVAERDFARGNWWGAEVKLQQAGGPAAHVGLRARSTADNFRQDQYNYDASPYFQYLDDRRSSTNWALYVQDEIKLHEQGAREPRRPPRPVRHVRRHDESARGPHLHTLPAGPR